MYLFIYLFICLFVYLFIHLIVYLEKSASHHIIISSEKPVSRLEQVVS